MKMLCSVHRAIDLYFPAHAVVYEEGLLQLPSKVKWFNSDNDIHGTIGGLTELTLVKSTLNLRKTSKSQVTVERIMAEPSSQFVGLIFSVESVES